MEYLEGYKLKGQHKGRSVWPSVSILIVLAFVPVFLPPVAGEAASYCDRVRSGELIDPNLLLCEDFEAPTLISNTGLGNGQPYYGPWYDDTGFTGARGFNSYWKQNYNEGSAGGWTQGNPAPATVGNTCSFPNCFTGAWHPTNLWQANNFAAVAILQNGQFSSEVSGLGTGPSGTSSGGRGVFQGNASLAHRNLPGKEAGITGYKDFGSALRTFGVTMAMAHASNSDASGIWNQPWKHNEWSTPAGHNDGLFLFHNDPGTKNTIAPFRHFILLDGDSPAQCSAKVAAATVNAGVLENCDVAMYYRPSPATFNRLTDWPAGTWGCVRGHFENMGLSNARVRIWFRGPAGVEKLLIDFTMNMTGLSARHGYRYLLWNNYANANSGGANVPTIQTTFRYEDNVHIRAGAPVSCAQIGFGSSSGGSTPAAPAGPSAPTGLTVK